MNVGVTVGDPAGIGPEVLEKASLMLPGRVPSDVGLTIFGPAPVLERLVASVGHVPGVPVVDMVRTTPDLQGVHVGRYTRESGLASFAALDEAVSRLATGRIDSLVTGPICKEAFSEVGFDWPGQTEFVADALGCTDFAMMLAGPRLKVALVTTHLALRDVPSAITKDVVLSRICLCHRFLTVAGTGSRIAVAALNPHCSDRGRFGDEEERIITPAVSAARAMGIDVTGPLPADTVFPMAYAGRFDLVLAMYHDQGLGPLKLVHFSDAINVTIGLPRPRCAPDHGPAWDLAGSGRADPSSMFNALLFAVASCRGHGARHD